jgi:hypothetical protein
MKLFINIYRQLKFTIYSAFGVIHVVANLTETNQVGCLVLHYGGRGNLHHPCLVSLNLKDGSLFQVNFSGVVSIRRDSFHLLRRLLDDNLLLLRSSSISSGDNERTFVLVELYYGLILSELCSIHIRIKQWLSTKFVKHRWLHVNQIRLRHNMRIVSLRRELIWNCRCVESLAHLRRSLISESCECF